MAIGTSDRVRQDPDGIAVSDFERVLTWAEADDALNRATNAIVAADTGPEHRVAVFARNSVEVVLAHSAAMRAGVSSTPINAMLTVDEAAYILEDSSAAILFCGPESVDVAIEAARRAGVANVVAWRTPPSAAGVDDWAAWLAEGSPIEPPTDMAPRRQLLYTSGTTGRPKGTDLPFRGQASTVAEYLAALVTGLLGPGGDGPHLVVGPLHHTGPLMALRQLAAGNGVVVMPKFDAEQCLAAIERYRVATTVMVPTHFTRLLALPDEVRSRYDVGSLRTVAHTGAACPVPVKRAMIEWFGPVLVEAYGGSEAGTVCSITSEEWLRKPGSVGRPATGFDAVVVDDDGQECAPGQAGRLYFRDRSGRGLLYRHDDQKTAEAHIAPGVFTLGEAGYVDEDGYVFITDRTSDMVVSGGVNISPAEIEQVLVRHPGVRDAACIGVPDADFGESVKALIEPARNGETPTADDLVAFCREHLAGYKIPRSFSFVDDVGRNAMGKLDKKALRATHGGGVA